MRKVIFIAACYSLLVSQADAHHPAVDMVDAEVYDMISENVEDTPHAEFVFDETMGDGNDVSTIYIPTVTDAEDMIRDGLLTNLSLLDGDVTLTVEFSTENLDAATNTEPACQGNKWSEWGNPLKVTITHIYETE